MLAPPEDLPERTLTAALGASWRLAVASIEYLAVGFGSHHWLVVDAGGTRWFVTVDDFQVPHRDALQAALAGEHVAECGPYAASAARLIAGAAEPIGALLARYDELVAGADRSRAVLTHGEPHPGNTLRTPAGWKLIDWDTALLAPPERDLWLLGGDHAAYTAATGVAVVPEMLELYRLRWAIADLSIDVDRFRRPHGGNADDKESWELLRSLVERGLT